MAIALSAFAVFLFASSFATASVAYGSASHAGLGVAGPNLSSTTKGTATEFAGYDDSVSAQTSQVIGSWIQPTVTCASGTTDSEAGFWVKFYTVNLEVWLGTEGTCANRSGLHTSYEAFFEFSSWCSSAFNTCPLADFVNSWTPRPGDHILATITKSSSDTTVTIKDATSGNTFSQKCTNPPSGWYVSGTCVLGGGSTAALWGVGLWLHCNNGSCSLVKLDNFGSASFGKDYTGVANTNGIKVGSSFKTISSAGTVFELTMVSTAKSPKTMAMPSSLSKDGTSFTVSWQSAGP